MSRSAWSLVMARQLDGHVAAREFLTSIPLGVRAKLIATLTVVAAAPPPTFSGGGKWEAMHGEMGGWFEVRCSGPGREQFRLFCLLENGSKEALARLGYDGPAIVVVTGLRKRSGTLFSVRDYAEVRAPGEQYQSIIPGLFV